MVNFYAGDKEAANQEIDDEDDIDEKEREETDAMKELREIYNKLRVRVFSNVIVMESVLLIGVVVF